MVFWCGDKNCSWQWHRRRLYLQHLLAQSKLPEVSCGESFLFTASQLWVLMISP
jgi:hypothetical protein